MNPRNPHSLFHNIHSPKAFRKIAFGILSALTMLSAQTYDLSGRVLDCAGEPVAGAAITLSGTEVTVTSDPTGNFQLDHTVNITMNSHSSKYSLTQRVLTFYNPSATPLPVDIHQINGRRFTRTHSTFIHHGIHRLTLPELEEGLYFIRFSGEAQQPVFKLLYTRNGSLLLTPVQGSRGAPALLRESVASDFLEVTADGFKSQTLSLEGTTASVEIRLLTESQFTRGNGECPNLEQLWIVTFPGKNDATLHVFPDGKTQMVDAGTESNAQNRIIPFLKYHGVDKLDYFIGTHGHQDHAGGIAPLKKAGILNGNTKMDNERSLKIDQTFNRGGADFHISNAFDSRNETGANENSVSYRMEWNGFVMSGAGDEHPVSQRRFLNEHPNLVPAHVRYMAHHCVGKNPEDYIKALNSYLYICPITEGHKDLTNRYLEILETTKAVERYEQLIYQDYYFVIQVKSGKREDWEYFRCDNIEDCPVDFTAMK